MPESTARTRKTTAPEATDSPIIISFEGHQYKIPPADDWDSDALELMFEGNLPKAMKMICGEKVYQTFHDRHPSLGDLKKFMTQMGEQAGAGN